MYERRDGVSNFCDLLIYFGKSQNREISHGYELARTHQESVFTLARLSLDDAGIMITPRHQGVSKGCYTIPRSELLILWGVNTRRISIFANYQEPHA